MALQLIRISNIRNISEGEIVPDTGINIVAGPNGSGKTSLLEALFILGRGRSFRETRTSSIIKNGAGYLDVFGIVNDHGSKTRIGIRKSSRDTIVKLNTKRVKRLSTLARELPLHIVTPRSHEILESGSEYRRRFLEWGVFHVEHQYRRLSSRYHRVLSQRNAALKSQPQNHALWDRELDGLSVEMNRFRETYLLDLISYFQEDIAELLDSMEVEFEWKQGWDKDLTLLEVLQHNRSSDMKRGFTQHGPHRADFSIRLDGMPVKRWASRGQQKLIITALFLAQVRMIRDKAGKNPILLIDDLAAELDHDHRNKLMDRMKNNGNQVFITTTDIGLFSDDTQKKVFHVEHGVLTTDGV